MIMASETVVATVQSVLGTVVARSADGAERVLSAGDEVFLGEEIITSDGAFVSLGFPDAPALDLGANESIAITEDMLTGPDAEVADGALAPATAQTAEQIIAAIERGEDLDDLLDPAAAGAEGGSDSEGSSFVQVFRIDEPVSSVSYAVPGAQLASIPVVEDQGGDGPGSLVAPAPIRCLRVAPVVRVLRYEPGDPVEPVDPG
jgi:hypothetical protein